MHDVTVHFFVKYAAGVAVEAVRAGIAHWVETMKADKKAIFSAASLASAAVTYLFSLQPRSPEIAPGRPAELPDNLKPAAKPVDPA